MINDLVDEEKIRHYERRQRKAKTAARRQWIQKRRDQNRVIPDEEAYDYAEDYTDSVN